MKLYEIVENRRRELANTEKSTENIRAVSGKLTFEGTGEAAVETNYIPFGCIRFLEEPTVTFGYKIISGDITQATALVRDFEIDAKSMYKSCKFSVTINGEPATGKTYYSVEVYYTLTGRSYIDYKTGGETF